MPTATKDNTHINDILEIQLRSCAAVVGLKVKTHKLKTEKQKSSKVEQFTSAIRKTEKQKSSTIHGVKQKSRKTEKYETLFYFPTFLLFQTTS